MPNNSGPGGLASSPEHGCCRAERLGRQAVSVIGTAAGRPGTKSESANDTADRRRGAKSESWVAVIAPAGSPMRRPALETTRPPAPAVRGSSWQGHYTVATVLMDLAAALASATSAATVRFGNAAPQLYILW